MVEYYVWYIAENREITKVIMNDSIEIDMETVVCGHLCSPDAGGLILLEGHIILTNHDRGPAAGRDSHLEGDFYLAANSGFRLQGGAADGGILSVLTLGLEGDGHAGGLGNIWKFPVPKTGGNYRMKVWTAPKTPADEKATVTVQLQQPSGLITKPSSVHLVS